MIEDRRAFPMLHQHGPMGMTLREYTAVHIMAEVIGHDPTHDMNVDVRAMLTMRATNALLRRLVANFDEDHEA